MDKAVTRKTLLEARKALDPALAEERSAAIIERLCALPAFEAAQIFLVYVASKDNEVETKPLIQSLIENNRPVLVPIAEQSGQLLWSRLRDLDDLVPARFGILEPRLDARHIVTPPPDSVCIVPGVAFTADGWRIGYGGGYFDRFLEAYDGPAIALAYDMQIVSAIEPQPHDVPVDFVVTESRVYRRED